MCGGHALLLCACSGFLERRMCLLLALLLLERTDTPISLISDHRFPSPTTLLRFGYLGRGTPSEPQNLPMLHISHTVAFCAWVVSLRIGFPVFTHITARPGSAPSQG